MTHPAYQLQLHNSASAVDAPAWDALLARQAQPSPFMRHAYLAALQDSASACPATGWSPVYFCLWRTTPGTAAVLHAACVLYVKNHSRGEYVFDWAWARAYADHGLNYYPKAVLAVPFTPVPGSRLLAVDDAARRQLLQAVLAWAEEMRLSSLHLLFAAAPDLAAAQALGLMQRQTVQFHWHNQHPHSGLPFDSFEDFLASLTQEKRKKIRQERRRVAQAGVRFELRQGAEIRPADWDFFYHCYERTYLEHGNPPYLTRDFFTRMADTMAEHWLLCTALRDDQPIACSLIAIDAYPTSVSGQNDIKASAAYGRYWGALERVDCLHFEACYYQPLEWCIAQGVQRFEGGAQGEHKMARALLPTATHSAHWLAHPAFARAVDDFLQREGEHMQGYLDHLEARSPFKPGD